MKKSITRGLAALLAALLIVPANVLPASAAESVSAGDISAAGSSAAEMPAWEASSEKASQVICNPGAGYFTVYDWNSVSGNDALLEGLGLDPGEEADVELFQEYYAFDENGNYTIQAEPDAFFPYAVEFTVNGEKTVEWFETPDSAVEVGGHTFRLSSEITGEQITGMTLQIAGDTVVVYPEKEFVNEPLSMVSTMSMLPLREKYLSPIDLNGYTPVELTKVSVSALIGGEPMASDKLAWSYTSGRDDYEVSGTADKIDLGYYAYAYTYTSLQLIDNNGEQLNGEATRYILPLEITESGDWLEASAYKKAQDGSRVNLSTYHVDYDDSLDYREDGSCRRLYVYFDPRAVKPEEQFYLKLNVNDTIFPRVKYAALKAFAGEDRSTEITSALFSADTEGYAVSLYQDPTITLEAYDAAGQVTGTLPIELSLSSSLFVTGVRENGLYDAAGQECTGGGSIRTSDTVKKVTMKLKSGYAANAVYYWKPYYGRDTVIDNSLVTAAYTGSYSSISEAQAAGAADIKDVLFGTQGYGADYSGAGVAFTIFVGADGTAEQEIYRYVIACTESEPTQESLSSSTYFYIAGLYNEMDNPVHRESVGDSYGDSSYITYYVDKEVDLTKLKLDFSLADGAKLYAGDTEVKRKETMLDFSKGPLQLTVAAEDGESSKNYWVAVYKPIEGAGQLYVNSLTDEAAKTEVKDGVVYSVREVMLDSIHDNIHSIMVANLGTEPIANLKAELSADATVALDEYWQLDGKHSLEGFSDSYGYVKNEDGSFSSNTSDWGRLWNLAKVRLVRKEGVEDGADVTGTLTFKSGETTLMVLTLTGTVGDPAITTKEIPGAVKYVPYGVMIQNSNKYSWNKVTYRLNAGRLPAGMTLKPNGEIYGVPAETGEFSFEVRMENSSSRFQNRYVYKEFTLIVAENTDANVEAATDEGYTILDRIPNLDWDAEGSYSIRSQGEYAAFQDIYLDGVKLVEGTDYTKSEGSTRVTINSQTLKASKAEGTHTLGMEFREGATAISEGSLKRAAQNYYLGDASEEDDDNNDGGSSGGSQDSGSSEDGSHSSSGSSSGTAAAEGMEASAKAMELSYTVVKGDTLSRIAARNHMSLAELLKLNPQIKNPNLIYIGQVIHLGSRVVQVSGPAARQEVGVYYTVEKNDCLYMIARKYKISLAQLMSLNPQLAGQKYIFPNQRIRVS